MAVIRKLDDKFYRCTVFSPDMYSVNKCVYNYAVARKLMFKDSQIRGTKLNISYDSKCMFKLMKKELEQIGYLDIFIKTFGEKKRKYDKYGLVINSKIAEKEKSNDMLEKMSDLDYLKK